VYFDLVAVGTSYKNHDFLTTKTTITFQQNVGRITNQALITSAQCVLFKSVIRFEIGLKLI
jgi:hypothetical protein